MAYINDKGEIELTDDDRNELRGLDRLDVNGIMNWVIWGNKEGFNRLTIQKND